MALSSTKIIKVIVVTDDIDRTVDALVASINNLRAMSPLWEDFKAGKGESLIEKLGL